MWLFFLHPVSRASLFILIFSPLLYTQPHTLSHVTPRLVFMPLFFCLFSLSARNGISYRENVLNGTGGLQKQVLYEENVLGGTKSVGIWFRLKRLFGTKWTS